MPFERSPFVNLTPSAPSPFAEFAVPVGSLSAVPSGVPSGGPSNNSAPRRPSPLRTVSVPHTGRSLFGSAPSDAATTSSTAALSSVFSNTSSRPLVPIAGGSRFGSAPSSAATAPSSTAAPQRGQGLRLVLRRGPNTSASSHAGTPSTTTTASGEPPRTRLFDGPSHNPGHPDASGTPRSPIVNASYMGTWEQTTLSNYDKADMVTLVVGTEEHQFLAHKSYLSQHPNFFKAALKREWIEGQTRIVKLPDEQPDIVAQYLDHCYGRGLPTASKPSLDPAQGCVYEVLTELFALGERLLDSNIRNAIINEIIKCTTAHTLEGVYYPGARAINNIYNCTTSASPARRLMVELYVTAGKKDWFTDDLHPAFVMDLGTEPMAEVQSSSLACRSRKGNTEADHYRIVFG